MIPLFIAGALLGAGYAVLFHAVDDGPEIALIKGIPLGLLAWLLLAVNLNPVLMGQSPMWQVDTIEQTLPKLIAYLLMGSLTGALYHLTFRVAAVPLRLVESKRQVPEISTRIVILGGGYAGVAAAEKLEEAFCQDLSVAMWLVSENNYMLHTPMLSEVSASTVDAQHIVPSLRSTFHHVQVVQAEVDRVDMEARRVHTITDARSAQFTLDFDHLILTAGGVPNFFGNQNVEKHCFTFKSLDDAVLLRNQIIDMFERADIEPARDKRTAMLTFVVAGGGFAGVELIGGINDFARGIVAFYPNVAPEDIRIVLIHARDTILPELSVELGKYAQQKLEERGVEFQLQKRVTNAEPGRVYMGDEWVDCETFVWTAGNRPSPVLERCNIPLTQRGQIEVNEYLAAVDAHNIWAAGDCAQIPDRHSRTGFAPPTAQHAQRAGKVAGYNVAAAIQKTSFKKFDFKTLGSLAILGHQLAVAEVFGLRFSGFLAWLMWRAIYLSKLPTLQKRLRVGLDWLLDIFFPPDIVQTIDVRSIHRVQGVEHSSVTSNGNRSKQVQIEE